MNVSPGELSLVTYDDLMLARIDVLIVRLLGDLGGRTVCTVRIAARKIVAEYVTQRFSENVSVYRRKTTSIIRVNDKMRAIIREKGVRRGSKVKQIVKRFLELL